jgi:hypothetical protein
MRNKNARVVMSFGIFILKLFLKIKKKPALKTKGGLNLRVKPMESGL